MKKDLIKKYNVPGPRYTSYPTVPHWNDYPSQLQWREAVKKTFDVSNSSEGISVYVHLPYCESLCTFCGCNMRVSNNHSVELPYIEAVLKEWKLYVELFDGPAKIKEIHFGGGTPTFFSPENLTYLIQGICREGTIAEHHEFSFEAHPKNTSKEHLKTLFDLGFNRLSLGIQDFDPKVQDVINRVQPYEMVEEVVKNAREVGYQSINFDLIYGLPLQNKDSVIGTIEKVNTLRPERIAFYSYAHVPWDSKMQRKFDESDLPADSEKRELYEIGKEMFYAMGYAEVGMDHFALPEDTLFKAIENNTLHRNFMGYTANSTQLMVGLGISSISDSWHCFAQNTKSIREYKELISEGQLPIKKGHQLTQEELVVRKHILNLMCHFNTQWEAGDFFSTIVKRSANKLTEMEQERLLHLNETSLSISELGKIFVRNICMLLDPKLLDSSQKGNLFSKTI